VGVNRGLRGGPRPPSRSSAMVTRSPGASNYARLLDSGPCGARDVSLAAGCLAGPIHPRCPPAETSGDEYGRASIMGHCNPLGNHFFEHAIKERLVERLAPKPMSCRNRRAGFNSRREPVAVSGVNGGTAFKQRSQSPASPVRVAVGRGATYPTGCARRAMFPAVGSGHRVRIDRAVHSGTKRARRTRDRSATRVGPADHAACLSRVPKPRGSTGGKRT